MGKSGPLDAFGDGRQRGLFVGLVVLQAPEHRLGELAQVVRRHVGGHADRDAARTVGQQVREPARQDRRLLHPAVVVRDEIDCLLVDFTQHLHRQRSEARLGVVADETVGDECVVVGVDPQAVHRLHARIGHRGDARVVEAAVGEILGDRTDVGIGDVAEDLSAVALPPRDSRSMLCLRNHSLSIQRPPPCCADKAGQARDVIAVADPQRVAGQRSQEPLQLVLLRAAETDLLRRTARLAHDW